jgi:hypothetical protein
LDDPPNFTQNGIFGVKMYHLAAQASSRSDPGNCSSLKMWLLRRQGGSAANRLEISFSAFNAAIIKKSRLIEFRRDTITRHPKFIKCLIKSEGEPLWQRGKVME